MKREFTLTREQTKEFLRYFNSLVRNPDTGRIEGDGSGRFEGKYYIWEQAARINVEGKKIFFGWRIIQTLDSELVSIENTNSFNNSASDLLLSKLVSNALENAFTKKKISFFKRNYFRTIADNNLPGEYWINNFRFAPLFPQDSSGLINAERILVIDHIVEAIDISHANELAKRKSKLLSVYLSFILDHEIEEVRHEVLYFLQKNNGTFSMERNSTQLIDVNLPEIMPTKGKICKQIKFEGSIFDENIFSNQGLLCPLETRKIFAGIENASADLKSAINKCFMMYQIGAVAGKSSPTIKAPYEYGAVDTIVNSNKSEYKSFTNFMTKYAGENREFYDFLHSKIRSAHWHSGELNFGELNFDTDSTSSHERIFTFSTVNNAHRLIRKAILNWLNEKIKFANEIDDQPK